MSLIPVKGIALFTDGSSWTGDHIGGWAWCAIDCFDNHEVGTGYEFDTTNNRMEMQAWIEGLNALYECCGSISILVYSDSEYVGLGAMDRSRSRKKNRDLWTALDAAMNQHEYVEFVHVYGHRDSEYNNLVDKLAGEMRVHAQALEESVPQ